MHIDAGGKVRGAGGESTWFPTLANYQPLYTYGILLTRCRWPPVNSASAASAGAHAHCAHTPHAARNARHAATPTADGTLGLARARAGQESSRPWLQTLTPVTRAYALRQKA